jgi:uncharacterized membrane protein YsdA (DUF1294 family)
MSGWILAIAFVFLTAVNGIAFWMFYWDKWCAENNRRRISEASLLLAALAGGSAGAIAAQQKFRHKTRKEPFRSLLFSIAAIQAVILITLTISPLRRMTITALGGPYRSACVEQFISAGDLGHFVSCLERA